MNVISPMTGKENVKHLATINVADVLTLWNNRMNIDISNEMKGIKELQYYECIDSGLKFFHPMITGSEEFYEALQSYEWYYLEEKSEYDFASRFISNDNSMLEVGCGRGAFAEKIKPETYVGLEFSRTAIEMASSAGIDVKKESIEDYSKSHENEYDVVCSFQVLEHVSDVKSFIASCVKCVKPGGYLIYSVPSADSYIARLQNSVMNMPPHHISHWPDSTFAYVANEYGLTIHAIDHEIMSDIHVEQYSQLVCSTAIDSYLGRKFLLVEMTIATKIILKLAKFVSFFVSRALRDKRLRPKGHSVTVVYKKNDS